MNKIGKGDNEPIFLDVMVDGVPARLRMELDTGAKVSVIPEETWKAKFPDVVLFFLRILKNACH